MGYSRQLIDQIKHNFAKKLTVQLRTIVQTKDPELWSDEAVVAAEELLAERAAGKAVEPKFATVEDPPPNRDATTAGLLAGLSLLTLPFGFMVLPMLGNDEDIEDTIALDMPIPFGADMAWLAIKTTETAKVAASLGLGGGDQSQWRRVGAQKPEVRESTWELGLEAAYKGLVYVTPPLGEWTLAVSATLFPTAGAESFIKLMLERLSTEFGEAQYFCTNHGNVVQAWARAINGELLRGYCEWNDASNTYWAEGAVTKQELALNIRFRNGESPAAATDAVVPNEGIVLQLASYWSLDPSTLDEHFKESVLGLLGNGPWARPL